MPVLVNTSVDYLLQMHITLFVLAAFCIMLMSAEDMVRNTH